jgi:hypothetical protein
MLKFAVVTNISYEEVTLPILLQSMIDVEIDLDLIHVFSGGYQEYSYEKRNYHYHKLNHHTYEYSALIAIIEHQIESEYWFLIHDTCRVGPNFKKLVYNIPESRPEKIALTASPSMSMGSYRYDYLLSDTVKHKLLSIKNTDYSKEKMSYLKYWGVPNEDFILHRTQPPAHYYSPEMGIYYNMEHIDNNNWYGTQVERRTEYYKTLDLYKNKANWFPRNMGEYIIGA